MPFLARTSTDHWVAVRTVDLRQLPVTRRWKVYFEVIDDLGWTDLPADDTSTARPAWRTASVRHVVPSGMHTDLASVPPFLWGVIASYGRQTLPALLHDMLCYAAALPGQPVPTRRAARREADDLFRSTLQTAGSGPLRRWLMWSAVRLFGRPGVAVTFLLAALAVPTALLSGRTWAWLTAGVAVLALLVASAIAAVESTRVAGSGAGQVHETSITRWSGRAWLGLLGAVGVAALVALPIVALGLATMVVELAVGWGEHTAAERRTVTARAADQAVPVPG